MAKHKLNMHSMIDAITNSSTETYSQISEAGIQFTYDLLQNVIDAMKIKANIKDLFNISLEYDIDLYDLTEFLTEHYLPENYPDRKVDENLIENIIEDLKDELDYKEKDGEVISFWRLSKKDSKKIVNESFKRLDINKQDVELAYVNYYENNYDFVRLVENSLVIIPKDDKANKIYADFLSIIDSETSYDG